VPRRFILITIGIFLRASEGFTPLLPVTCRDLAIPIIFSFSSVGRTKVIKQKCSHAIRPSSHTVSYFSIWHAPINYYSYNQSGFIFLKLYRSLSPPIFLLARTPFSDKREQRAFFHYCCTFANSAHSTANIKQSPLIAAEEYFA